MDNFTKSIKDLNTAFKKFNSALEIFDKYIHLNKDLETHIYRIRKSAEQFNQCILKELHKQNVDDQFKEITKKLEKEK